MATVIRKATIEDVQLVARFVHSLLSELEPDEDIAASDVETTARLLFSKANIVAMLAFDKAIPLGVIIMNECAAIYAGGKFGEISELYVVLDGRSKGVASDLVSEAVAYGRANGWRRLEVGAPPQPAWARTLAFYERENFEHVGPRLRRII